MAGLMTPEEMKAEIDDLRRQNEQQAMEIERLRRETRELLEYLNTRIRLAIGE